MYPPKPTTLGRRQRHANRNGQKETMASHPFSALVALVALVTLALPWVLSSRTGREWLLGRANRVLAPGRLELDGLEFSWLAPTRMSRFVLVDEAGERVVNAPTAVWDRTLFQAIFMRPTLGTLRLDGAVIDAQRTPDGKIDLVETLRPVLGLDPDTTLRIVVPDGRLRFRSPALPEPVVANHASITVQIPENPLPVKWWAKLANVPENAPRNSLEMEGRFWPPSAPGGAAELEISLEALRWPWTVERGGVIASGTLDGKIGFALLPRGWAIQGDASLKALDVASPWLAGDRLHLEEVKGIWDVSERGEGLGFKRLEFSSQIATVKAVKSSSAPAVEEYFEGNRIEGRLDLAALAARLPNALRLREGVALERGVAEFRVEPKGEPDQEVVEISARVSDLVARDHGKPFTLRDPATLAARLSYSEGVMAVERFLGPDALPERRGQRGDFSKGVNLTASIDLSGLQEQLRELLDFGPLKLAGQGELTGSYRVENDQYRGRLNAGLHKLRVAGIGPGPLAREAVELVVDLDGPTAASGLPMGWDGLKTRLTSAGASADLTAHGSPLQATVVVDGPIVLPGRQARAGGRIEARWDEKGVSLDPVVLTLSPADGQTTSRPIKLAARGRFDRSRGELVFEPGGVADAIGLTPDGLRVSGLGTDKGLRVDGGFAGELAALATWVDPGQSKLQGRWSARLSGSKEDDGFQLGGKIDVEGFGLGNGSKIEGERFGVAVRALVPGGGKSGDSCSVACAQPCVCVCLWLEKTLKAYFRAAGLSLASAAVSGAIRCCRYRADCIRPCRQFEKIAWHRPGATFDTIEMQPSPPLAKKGKRRGVVSGQQAKPGRQQRPQTQRTREVAGRILQADELRRIPQASPACRRPIRGSFAEECHAG